jgi:hypothetical protein
VVNAAIQQIDTMRPRASISALKFFAIIASSPSVAAGGLCHFWGPILRDTITISH